MAQSESSFQRRVIRDLKTLRRTYAYKCADRAKKGKPDFYLCVNGIFVGLEIKRDGEEPTPLQRNELEKISLAHGRALWSTPKTWASVFSYLKQLADND